MATGLVNMISTGRLESYIQLRDFSIAYLTLSTAFASQIARLGLIYPTKKFLAHVLRRD